MSFELEKMLKINNIFKIKREIKKLFKLKRKYEKFNDAQYEQLQKIRRELREIEIREDDIEE